MSRENRKKRVCALALCGVLALGVLAPYARAASSVQAAADGTVTWEELEERILNGSLNAKILSENIQSIESMDYQMLEELLRLRLNSMSEAQWYMNVMGNTSGASSLASASATLRETFESVRDGDMQKDNADAVRQLQNAARQIAVAGQTLYLNLLSMEQSRQDALRGLDTIDRNLKELRLRQQLGQVSEQKVRELEQTRTSTASQIETLEETIKTYTVQLQTLMGEKPTGKLTLGALPEIAGEVPADADYQTDLDAAKTASWALYSAQLTMDDAKDDWLDARRSSTVGYQYQMADHTWNAAQITYQSTVQDFETSFDKTRRAVADAKQVWESKQASVAYQEKQLEIAQLKYERGMIAYARVLDAQDSLAAARSAAASAYISYFTAVHNYQTAVEYGML